MAGGERQALHRPDPEKCWTAERETMNRISGMGSNTKNKNVYKVDGRFYVKEIKRCICDRKYDGLYVLDCRIKERGEKEYSCGDDPKCIQRFLETKDLWLSDQARDQVNNAITRFNRNYEEAMGGSFTKVPIEGCQVTFYYRHLGKDKFDVLLDFERAESIIGNARLIQIFKESTLRDMFQVLNWQISGDEKMKNLLLCSTEKTIEKNPIYISAIEKNNKVMQRLIKLYYQIADDEDCRELSKDVFDTNILPPLTAEHDKAYCVESETISVELLKKSGYLVFHRPYFAMKGSTHSKWQLNPHTKSGVDAGPVNEDAITFEEYLKLFQKKE